MKKCKKQKHSSLPKSITERTMFFKMQNFPAFGFLRISTSENEKKCKHKFVRQKHSSFIIVPKNNAKSMVKRFIFLQKFVVISGVTNASDTFCECLCLGLGVWVWMGFGCPCPPCNDILTPHHWFLRYAGLPIRLKRLFESMPTINGALFK